ncbi:hypothetical protein [Variovorax ginsengisoli]|uniref:Uncharacterized protein n=1 Tax=Variovorax ginsengisoli TaxID=363844 RepID=A0ABT8SE75_9BURK|nr:hypothetical protein [Variovorax ginsengisoli]MDN8618056.1 hypothetical protein [Variovorax ginsengisoli]MDO1537226.1 hypothetical protein [Variovorax ginsengisoli]
MQAGAFWSASTAAKLVLSSTRLRIENLSRFEPGAPPEVNKEMAMKSLDLETVQMVRVALQEVISAREHGVHAVPYFAPTDIGALPPSEQEKELGVREETDYGNRARAGIHLTLSAAVSALEVAEVLMRDLTIVDSRDRKRELLRCSLNARMARDAAAEAAAVLSGQQAPKSDARVEVNRLKSELFERFGLGE